MAITLERAKRYNVLDPSDADDVVLSLCIGAAEEYLANAGVIDDGSSLYELAVYMLAGHWYENRGLVVVGTVTAEIELSMRSVLHQLKLKEDT